VINDLKKLWLNLSYSDSIFITLIGISGFCIYNVLANGVVVNIGIVTSFILYTIFVTVTLFRFFGRRGVML